MDLHEDLGRPYLCCTSNIKFTYFEAQWRRGVACFFKRIVTQDENWVFSLLLPNCINPIVFELFQTLSDSHSLTNARVSTPGLNIAKPPYLSLLLSHLNLSCPYCLLYLPVGWHFLLDWTARMCPSVHHFLQGQHKTPYSVFFNNVVQSWFFVKLHNIKTELLLKSKTAQDLCYINFIRRKRSQHVLYYGDFSCSGWPVLVSPSFFSARKIRCSISFFAVWHLYLSSGQLSPFVQTCVKKDNR